MNANVEIEILDLFSNPKNRIYHTHRTQVFNKNIPNINWTYGIRR